MGFYENELTAIIADLTHRLRECKGYPLSLWGFYRILIIRYAIQNTLRNLSMTLSLNSGEVKAIQVHHLVPGRDKVMDKLRLRVRTSIHLGQGPELRVRTEDEVDGG